MAYLKVISEDFLIGRNQDSWSSCRKSDLKSAGCDVKSWNFIEARRISLNLACEDVNDPMAWNGEVALIQSAVVTFAGNCRDMANCVVLMP